jgi:hypothetical protein
VLGGVRTTLGKHGDISDASRPVFAESNAKRADAPKKRPAPGGTTRL